MDYCEGGSLADLDSSKLTERDLKFYIAQIVLAVDYMHERNIIHRVQFIIHQNYLFIGFKVSKHLVEKK